MAFAIYFFIGWLTIICFFVQKKKYSIVENTVLILSVLIINLNWTWLVYEEFELITYSREPWDFVAYLIKRSIVIPNITNAYPRVIISDIRYNNYQSFIKGHYSQTLVDIL